MFSLASCSGQLLNETIIATSVLCTHVCCNLTATSIYLYMTASLAPLAKPPVKLCSLQALIHNVPVRAVNHSVSPNHSALRQLARTRPLETTRHTVLVSEVDNLGTGSRVPFAAAEGLCWRQSATKLCGSHSSLLFSHSAASTAASAQPGWQRRSTRMPAERSTWTDYSLRQ